MQEQTRENLNTPAKPKLPAALIAVIAVVGLLGIGGIVTAYVLMHNSYTGYLDQLKAAIATAEGKFQNGDPGENAALDGQYNFYVALNDEIGGLSAALDKLNNNYPLLPGRASDKSLGLYGLRAQMGDTYGKLATLKQCMDEDASIAQKLTELLAADASTDISLDMASLSSRNDALDISISGIAFSGPLEDRRAEFASGIKKRGDALHYLKEDAAVQGELLTLLSSTQMLPADLIPKFGDLKAKNDALTGKIIPIEIEGVSLTEADLNAQVAGRKTMIEASTGYFTELTAVQNGVAEFCRKLKESPVSGATFAERFAGYTGYFTQLKALEAQIKTINEKPAYAALPVKHTAADLGMTPEGQSFLKYEAAIDTLNTATTKSAAMEKQIDTLLKDTKMTLPDKISALDDMTAVNRGIVNTPLEGVPEDLTQGFTAFLDGCRERATFLNEFMAYVDCKVKADGHKALSNSYLANRSDYLESAAYWEKIEGASGDNVKHFKQLASDQSSLASTEKKGYNDCLKEANTHKAAYEASRKKYKEMFAK